MVARARQVSLRAKEAKWLESCATLNQHTSPALGWRNLRRASGAAPPHPTAHSDPQQGAESLVDAFITLGTSNQPPLTPANSSSGYGRSATLQSGRRDEPDVTDQPFAPQEMATARRGRETAAGADGVTYSMLAHAGTAGDAALLALLNASWMAGRLPPAWKDADIPKPKEPNSFRPISLLSCRGKTAERMVLSRLQGREQSKQSHNHAGPNQQPTHHHCISRPRKSLRASQLTHYPRRPCEKGDPRTPVRLALGLFTTAPGLGQVSGLQILLQGIRERDPTGRHTQLLSIQLPNGASSGAAHLGGHHPPVLRRRPRPRRHQEGQRAYQGLGST